MSNNYEIGQNLYMSGRESLAKLLRAAKFAGVTVVLYAIVYVLFLRDASLGTAEDIRMIGQGLLIWAMIILPVRAFQAINLSAGEIAGTGCLGTILVMFYPIIFSLALGWIGDRMYETWPMVSRQLPFYVVCAYPAVSLALSLIKMALGVSKMNGK